MIDLFVIQISILNSKTGILDEIYSFKRRRNEKFFTNVVFIIG